MIQNLVAIINRFYIWFILFLLAFFFFIVGNDPLFGDGISTISRASYHIINSGFSEFTYPSGQDPGHPTLFPAIYALLWSVFGISLIISHLFNFTFAFLSLVIVYRWMRKEEGILAAISSLFLLLLTPLFLAQTAMVNTHLPLTFFTIWLAYALYYHLKYQAVIAATFLVLCHLQGLFLLASIGLWWIFIHLKNKNWKFRITKALKLGIVPALFFSIWLLYHYQKSGWLISVPASDYYGRGFGGLKISVINWAVSVWRMIDYGQIAFFIPIVLLFFKKELFKNRNQWWMFFLIIFLLNSFLVSFTTTLRTAHRYFLPMLPFIVMASVSIIHNRFNYKWLYMITLVLLSGHFWQYPGRTVGDATLSYRNTFSLLEQINLEVKNKDVFTYAPLSDASEFAYLGDAPVNLQSLYDSNTNISDVFFVLKGNISGDFSDEEIHQLENNWYAKTFESGEIYLNLYANPDKVPKPENWTKLPTKSRLYCSTRFAGI